MRRLMRGSSAVRVAIVAVLVAARSTGFAGESSETPGVDPRLGSRFAAAVDDAAERLDSGPCALVLQDFVDTITGQPLAATLAATGRSASEHVRTLRFERDPKPPRSGRMRIYAYTTPRGSVVYICWYDFSRILKNRRLATAVVIHETLHTLGLGNDLPSSIEITDRVLARCGSRP